MHAQTTVFFITLSPPSLQHLNMAILAILLCLSLGYLVPHQVDAQTGIDPTEGFTSLPLTQSNLAVQRPYDVPVDQRYSFKDGVHTLWVFDTDKPHTPTSATKPRTEIRISVSHLHDSSISTVSRPEIREPGPGLGT